MALIAFLAMAKKRGRRRKFRPYLKGQLDVTKLLGTLGSETTISVAVIDTVEEKAWLSSVKATFSMKNFTKAADSGPITFGLAHSDYTNAEIAEYLDNLSSWSQGDLRNQEIARRKIRRIGQFTTPDAITETAWFNQGRPITTKCGWQLITGQTVKFWWHNEGAAALATTDPVCQVNGHANLWPN